MSKTHDKNSDTDLDLFGSIPAPGSYDPFAGIDPALLGRSSSGPVAEESRRDIQEGPQDARENIRRDAQEIIQEHPQSSKNLKKENSPKRSIQIVNHQINDPAFHLQDNYATVLDYLLGLSVRVARLSDISEATKIPFGTVRKAIDRLVSDGFISKPKRYISGRIKGFSFEVNKPRCKKFLALRRDQSTEGMSTE